MTDDKKDKLEQLKSRKSLSKSGVQEAAELLSNALDDGEYDFFAESVMKLHPDASAALFKRYELTDDSAESIAAAFGGSEAFHKDSNSCATKRGMTFVSAMLRCGVSPRIIADFTFPLINKTGKKRDAAVNEFNKYVAGEYQDKFFALSEVCANKKDDFSKFCDEIKNAPPPEKSKPTGKSGNAALIDIIEALRKDIASISAKCDMIPELKTTLENHALSANVTVPSDGELKKAQEETARLEAQNQQLSDDLKKAYEIDNSNKDQALAALRGNIADALKLEYGLMLKIGDNVDEDNYIALKSILKRVFKTLGRFGVNME